MQNPILNNQRSFYSYLAIWTVVIICHALMLWLTEQLVFATALVDAFVSNLLFAAIGLGLWFPAFFGKTDNEKFISSIFNHLAALLVTISLWLGISYFLLMSVFNNNAAYITFLQKSMPWRAGIGVLIFEVIILVYYLFIFYQNYKDKLVKESELKALVKESELNSLKSQINPHFLFNSLNSISSLTMIQPGKAQEMIIKLSDFLRYSISNKDEKLTPLSEEISNINRYLDIEKIRFGKRLSIQQQVEPSCLQLKLPGMILQPLVENAVKYGVYETLEESVLQITCTCNVSALSISISNEYDPDYSYKKGEGIGLRNIRSRLHIMYGRDDLLFIRKDLRTFEVKVMFPQQ